MNSGSSPNSESDFQRRHRVRWRETDASGYVHFANYIRMMEETEYAFLRSRGLSVVSSDARGVIGFPRVSTNIEIHQPACLDDELVIGMRVSGNDGVKIEYRFTIQRQSHPVASGRFVVACCRFPPGKPPRAILIPDFVTEQLSGR